MKPAKIIDLDTYFIQHGTKKMRDLGQRPPAPHEILPIGLKLLACWLLLLTGCYLLIGAFLYVMVHL